MTLFIIINFSVPQQPDEDDSSSDSSQPLVVSVTYLWQHPLIELLKLNKTKDQKIYITNDFQVFETGSLVKDIPNFEDLDLNDNQTIIVLPW